MRGEQRPGTSTSGVTEPVEQQQVDRLRCFFVLDPVTRAGDTQPRALVPTVLVQGADLLWHPRRVMFAPVHQQGQLQLRQQGLRADLQALRHTVHPRRVDKFSL